MSAPELVGLALALLGFGAALASWAGFSRARERNAEAALVAETLLRAADTRYGDKLAEAERSKQLLLEECDRALERALAAEQRIQELENPIKELTQQQREAIMQARCFHCGGAHQIACPRVRSIRFRPDGQTPLAIEYWADGEWPKDRVLFLEDYPEAPAEAS